MLTITNRKVAGFEPRWAPFRGFSLLFDNPGDSFTRAGSRLGLTANLADHSLVFYRLLHESLVHLDKDHLLNVHLFCALPPTSYHVTVWDGINDGNIDQLQRLTGLRFKDSYKDSPIPFAKIRFRFERLGNWSNTSVVAELAPADEESLTALQRLVGQRAIWNNHFHALFGISPSNPHHFAPHVSLGYFANREQATQILPLQQEWNATLAETMRDNFLPLRGISLYGFTDMATFFKRAVPH